MAENEQINRFLVIGAGASLGARCERSEEMRPPLGSEFSSYLRCWMNANDPAGQDAIYQVQSRNERNPEVPPDDLWNHRASAAIDALLIDERPNEFQTGNFEKRLACWRREHPEHVALLNRIIAHSFLHGACCGFPEKRDLFDQLLKKTQFREGLAVITLNYDTLFEEALCRVAGSSLHEALRYPGLRMTSGPNGTVPVFKLHGSVNWLAGSGYSVSSDLAVARANRAQYPPMGLSGIEGDRGPETHMDYVPPGGRHSCIMELKHRGSTAHPLLALYTVEKSVPFNWECVNSTRESCLDEIGCNPRAKVDVVGVHIPEPDKERDDPIFLRVMQQLGALEGDRIFWNPSASECERATRFGFATRDKDFESFVRDST